MAMKVLVGTVLGFLTGLGIGGGSLLMLWLTVVMKMARDTARTINLLFFLPSALAACCFRWKQGSLPGRKILPAVIAGAASAALFSRFGPRIDADVLQKGFGVLLIATGLREVLYRPGKEACS